MSGRTASDPYRLSEPSYIAFSGGRSSAYMLYRILDANGGLPPDCYVLFANTGREVAATYKFISRCEREWKTHIHWLEYDGGKIYREVIPSTSARKGEPFARLVKDRNFAPSPVSRICTQHLKIELFKLWMLDHGYEKYSYGELLGLRADEPHRIARMKAKAEQEGCNSRAPMAEAGDGLAEVNTFWAKAEFDLELPLHNGRALAGNCDLCFLKGKGKLIQLMRAFKAAGEQERIDWWKDLEKGRPSILGHKQRYETLDIIASSPGLDLPEPDVLGDSLPCGCTD